MAAVRVEAVRIQKRFLVGAVLQLVLASLFLRAREKVPSVPITVSGVKVVLRKQPRPKAGAPAGRKSQSPAFVVQRASRLFGALQGKWQIAVALKVAQMIHVQCTDVEIHAEDSHGGVVGVGKLDVKVEKGDSGVVVLNASISHVQADLLPDSGAGAVKPGGGGGGGGNGAMKKTRSRSVLRTPSEYQRH